MRRAVKVLQRGAVLTQPPLYTGPEHLYCISLVQEDSLGSPSILSLAEGGLGWRSMLARSRFLINPWDSRPDFSHPLPGKTGLDCIKDLTVYLASFYTGPSDLPTPAQRQPVSVCVCSSTGGQLFPCHIPKWWIRTRKYQHAFCL